MSGAWNAEWARVGDVQIARVLTFQNGEPFCYDAVLHVGEKAVEWCVGTCIAKHEGGTAWAISGRPHACMGNGAVRIPSEAKADGARMMAELLAETLIRNLMAAIAQVEGSIRWANIPPVELEREVPTRVVH